MGGANHSGLIYVLDYDKSHRNVDGYDSHSLNGDEFEPRDERVQTSGRTFWYHSVDHWNDGNKLEDYIRGLSFPGEIRVVTVIRAKSGIIVRGYGDFEEAA